ncbi:MAG: UDP-N-acetylmuramoyl-L-alanyl-D-glutamate--2,6-diaminopimelate ligase [bacterium]
MLATLGGSEITVTAIDELVRGLPGLRVVRGGDRSARRVRIDSRRVEKGDLFVALRGLTDDGLRHVPDALSRGAVGVVAPADAAAFGDAAWIAAEDPRLAAALLADRAWGHPSGRLDVVGVTGTNGKTTTTFLLRSILETAGRRVAVIGTVGAYLPGGRLAQDRTTPEAPDLQELLVRTLEEGGDAAVMEVSSHALDLRRVDGIAFAAAAFLNLSPEHLDWHGTLEAYGRSKMRLFSELLAEGHARGGPRAVLHAKDPWAARFRAVVGDALFFGAGGGDADVSAHGIRMSPGGSRFTLVFPGARREASVLLPGEHNVENALAAAALAHVLGTPIDAVVEGLARATAPPGRFERVHAGRFDAFVDYAHTEDGLERALRVARSITRGKLLVVLGCGGDRDRTKRPGMGRLAAEWADLAIFTTDNPRSEDPRAIIDEMLGGVVDRRRVAVVLDREEALGLAVARAGSGDVVLACGKGHETYQEIAGRKLPFPEREILARLATEREAAG